MTPTSPPWLQSKASPPAPTTSVAPMLVGAVVVGVVIVSAAIVMSQPAPPPLLVGTPYIPPGADPRPSPPPPPLGPKIGPPAPARMENRVKTTTSAAPAASAWNYRFLRTHLQAAVAGRRLTAVEANRLLQARRGQFIAAGVAPAQLPPTLFQET